MGAFVEFAEQAPPKKRKEKASAKQGCCGAMKAFTTRK
jgi:hypothetical protein